MSRTDSERSRLSPRGWVGGLVGLCVGVAVTGAVFSAVSDGASGPDPVAICGPEEPGQRLEFSGRVLDERGRPIPKASIIAYQTDYTGLYAPPGAEAPHPRLCAVAVTDAQGRYAFTTVMPGPYPDIDDPAHIHLHVDAALFRHRYVTFWFEGDPRLTPAKRRRLDGETVIVEPRKPAAGAWSFTHDVTLAGS